MSLSVLLEEAIRQHIAPGIAVGRVGRGGAPEVWTAGHLTYDSGAPPITASTLFDIASITKTFTATLALLLTQEGQWQLSDPLIAWVPEFQGDPTLTLLDLLEFRPEFALTLSTLKESSPQAVRQAILHATLARPLNRVNRTYSNTTSILLTLALEQCSGKTLPELIQHKLLTPLGLHQTTFFPKQKNIVAPTENDNWRGHLLQGEVHDESAWLLQRMGWTVGSAGLFSTATDLLTFLTWHLSTSSDNTLGWETLDRSWMGRACSHSSYGKTGFTGCSLLVDPEREVGIVLLSNAVHPQRPADRTPLNHFRQEVLNEILH